MQQQDFEWFVANFKDLYQQYGKTILAIKDRTVIGTFKTYADAVREVSRVEPIGSFIVQECGPDKSSYTVQIASLNLR